MRQQEKVQSDWGSSRSKNRRGFPDFQNQKAHFYVNEPVHLHGLPEIVFMRVPILEKKYVPPALIAAGILSVACIVINGLILPGWSYAGTVELLLLVSVYALFSGNWSTMSIRFGILVYAVSTGLMAVSRNHPAILGDFSFGNALGPFSNNVGLLIGMPWFLTVMLSYPVAAHFSNNIYFRSLLGALFALVPAVFLFHIGEKLDFFYWTEIAPPVRSYIVWFTAFFLLHFTGTQMELKPANHAAKPLYAIWLGFLVSVYVLRFFTTN